MYEVWYTQEGVTHTAVFSNLDKAVTAATDIVLSNQGEFGYLVGPDGEIRSDLVYELIAQERTKRKEKWIKDSGNPWVVEVRDQYREDVWGIYAEKPTESAALGVSAQLANLASGRVRVRQLQ